MNNINNNIVTSTCISEQGSLLASKDIPEQDPPLSNLESKFEIKDLILRDFQPINTWKIHLAGKSAEYWNNESKEEPMFIIDQSTNRKYLNETPGTVRFKCSLLVIGTPLIHLIASVINVLCLTLKLILFAHFWDVREGEKEYNLKGRIISAGGDLLRIVATPISLIALELSAIYGIFNPFDGRKLYASFERATYGKHILAPCFQPDPEKHLFGGDMSQKDAW